VHLAGEAVGIAATSGLVEVEVGVAVDDVVVGTIRTVVLADAGVGVFKLVAEAQLNARVVVLAEGAALNLVVRTFQLDAVIASLGNVQTVDVPVVALQLYAALG
jgi:hypothetical protein